MAKEDKKDFNAILYNESMHIKMCKFVDMQQQWVAFQLYEFRI